MRDVAGAFKTKYYQLLNGQIDADVFIDYVPATLKSENYVLITVPASVDASTFTTNDTDTSVQVGIYTSSSNGNNNYGADMFADEIYQIIYPTPGHLIDLTSDGFGKVGVELVNDNTMDVSLTNDAVLINRIITFRHRNIIHN